MPHKSKQKRIVSPNRDRKVFFETLVNPPTPSKRTTRAAINATKQRSSRRKRRNGDLDQLLKQAIQELRASLQSARAALKSGLTAARRTLAMKRSPISRRHRETSSPTIPARETPKRLSPQLAQLNKADRQLNRSLARLNGRLRPRRPFGETDAIELTQWAREIFGSSKKANEWFKQPNRALKGRTPFSLLSSQAGTKRVRTILGRIEHGMYG